MFEEFKGKIINDEAVCLPSLDDMNYNSLVPMLDIDLKTEETQFYIENPPDGEDAVGMSADGTIFTIKTGPGHDKNSKEAAFNISTLNIYTGYNSFNTLAATVSKCSVGDNAQNQDILKQLINGKQLRNYLQNKYGKNAYNLGDLKVQLLYVDGPKTPKYTTEWLERQYVKQVKYGEIKDRSSIYKQSFQAEFEQLNGVLSPDIKPNLKEYKDDDLIYIYNDTVQVWPYQKTETNIIDTKLDNFGIYKEVFRKITEEDYKRVGITKLELKDYSFNVGQKQFPVLDNLGRCKGSAVIKLNKSVLNNDARIPLSPMSPSGWHNYFFSCINYIDTGHDNDYDNEEQDNKRALYNRCHLLAHSLSGENINSRNIITGTDNFNKAGMYLTVEKPLKVFLETHPEMSVLYRVTPDFHGDNLVAHGILMEAISVEDNGDSFSCFFYIPNTQPEVVINYKTGEAWESNNQNSFVNNKYAKYYVLNKNEADPKTINLAIQMRNLAINTLLDAEDSRLCISTNALSLQDNFVAPYDPGFLDPATSIGSAIEKACNNLGDFFFKDTEWYRYSGYNMYGLDKYGRALGVVYVKIKVDKHPNPVWVNLNKYLIYHVYNSQEVKQSDYIPENLDFNSYYKDPTGERFKSWTYDIENFNYQDSWWTQLETRYGQDKRRREIQKLAFKNAKIHLGSNNDIGNSNGVYDCLKDWTISIGDVTFFCPPTAIRIISSTMTERMPVLRAKGSMAKNIEKADSEIELNLYFNNEYGINGQEVEVALWEQKDPTDEKKKKESDKKVKYYMNGLRALISEFKFTPFLPVVNTYLNRTLKIAAVSLEQLDIQTVPDFPRLLKATLRLKKFDYNVYMPEVPEMFVTRNEQNNEVENPFAQCINYDVMRYYYQKPLQYGNELSYKLLHPKESSYNFNSVEFIKDTLIKNKTALMPCQFEDPNIDIYIANEDYLKRLLNLKKSIIKKAASGGNYVPNGTETMFISDIKNLWVDNKVGQIFNEYNNYRIQVAEAFKRTKGPAFEKFEVTIKNKKIEQDSISLIEAQNLVEQYITKPMTAEIKAAVLSSSVENSRGELLVQDVYATKNVVRIKMNAPYNVKTADISNLWDQFLLQKKLKEKYHYNESILQESIIVLDLSDIGDNFTSSDVDEPLDLEYDPIVDFLDWCSTSAEDFLNANEEASELKEAMDWENAKSIQYDLVAEDIRVDLFQSSMMNNFARISLLDSEGYAPQYMGSSDIHISWVMTTKSEEFAMTMKSLPELEAYYMRKYHLVLPCFPIRIDSEFTRLLGVFEVSIENVVVETMEQFPGVYRIQVLAISTDRTLKNREALKSVDNQLDTNKDGISGELDNAGLTNSSLVTQTKIRSFDDLDEKLALAEIYPDLELPTIGELGELGFVFIRYKEKSRDRNDLFVDPDFYYYYPFNTSSEIIKRVIEANFNGQEKDAITNTKINTKDNSGTGSNANQNLGQNPDSNESVIFGDFAEKNAEMATTQLERLLNKQSLDLSKELLTAAIGDAGKWNISTKIMCSFTESFYLNLIDLLKDKNGKDKTEKAEVNTQVTDKEKKRIEKLKILKEFYDDKMTAKDKAVASLYDKLKKNGINAVNIDFSSIGDNELRSIENYNNLYKEAQQKDFDGDFIRNYLINNFSQELKDIYINIDELNTESFSNILKAIWAANTSVYEYNTNVKEEYWQGKKDFRGVFKAENGRFQTATKDTPFEKVVLFSPFFIKSYSYGEILNYLDEEEKKNFISYYENLIKTNPEATTHRFLLDPYYREQDDSVQKDYLLRCQNDINFAAQAYTRIMIWWLCRLYRANIFPNIGLDILGKITVTNNEATKRAKKLIEQEYGEKISVDSKLLENINNFVEENKKALDMGKLFCAFVMALYDMPLDTNPFYKMICSRNYSALNAKLRELVSEKSKKRGMASSKDAIFRKFLLALTGFKEIKGPEYIGRSKGVTPASQFINNYNTEIMLEAAKDPKQYVLHSFYDMLRTDYRGRMLRAFPTFYCMFMDEGKEIGLWKLHDNFYSINSIIDISIVKSRKIPADTCTLLLSNNYSTFTTDDEDGTINYRDATFGDLWDSVFHPRIAANRMEQLRLAASKINKAKLSPGIRIHVKEGYGSDARELGTVFNGVIASVEPNNHAVQIVAQGNGIELTNPILEDRDGDEIQYKDGSGEYFNNTEGGGATPRTIINSFLTTNNGAVKTYLRGEYSPNQWFWKDGVAVNDGEGLLDAWANWTLDVWESNAYGIEHFGDPKYKDVFPEGEIVQNIYEICEYPCMDNDNDLCWTPSWFPGSDLDETKEAPYISFESRGQTFWDILHICKSVGPEYITGTASFGLRDTIFFGKPHYYYAYGYKKVNHGYVEKRKPFQQFHFIYSDKDIISNNITASSDKMKTVATGLYKDKAGWIDRNKDVGPMWVDKDIYPENQKSMLVDTRLKMKDNNPLLFRNTSKDNMDSGNIIMNSIGKITKNTLQSFANVAFGAFATIGSIVAEDFLGGFFDDKGTNTNHKKVAWTATANALKESVKEMYQGEIIIIGNPSIKPQDRLYISDNYNDMNGCVLVRDVVHNLSAISGFTTTMHVDTISSVGENRNEINKSSYIVNVAAQAASNCLLNKFMYRRIIDGLSIIDKIYSVGNKKFGIKIAETFKLKKIEEIGASTAKAYSGLFKTMKELIPKATELMKTDNKLITKGVKLLGTVVAGGITAVSAPTIGAIALGAMAAIIIISEVIVTGIMGSLNDFLLYKIKDSQVLTIYPLKKNGVVYTAGLDGSLGLVYGSPTYGQFGPMGKIYHSIFAPENDGTVSGYIFDFMRSLVLDPSVQAEAVKLGERDAAYVVQTGNNSDDTNKIIESTAIGLNKKPQFTVMKKNGFDLSLGNRVIEKKKDNKEYRAIKNGLNRYHIERLDDLLKSSERKNQILIEQYEPLKPYIKSAFLLPLHNEIAKKENASDKKNLIELDVIIANQKVHVNGLKYEGDIIDVPLLSKDALIILKDITEKAWKELDIDNSKDETSIEEALNGTKISIMSALRVNDKNWYCSSGYSFSIKGLGQLSNGKLKNIIDEYYNNIKERLSKVNKEPCFEVIDVGGGEIRIKIFVESSLSTTTDQKMENKETKK